LQPNKKKHEVSAPSILSALASDYPARSVGQKGGLIYCISAFIAPPGYYCRARALEEDVGLHTIRDCAEIDLTEYGDGHLRLLHSRGRSDWKRVLKILCDTCSYRVALLSSPFEHLQAIVK
jgi:hypothetical protein